MPEKPLTHRERAEQALLRSKLDKTSVFCEDGAFDHYASIIARETYPEELVEAALEALNCPTTKPGLCHGCQSAIRAALTLYPKQEAPK